MQLTVPTAKTGDTYSGWLKKGIYYVTLRTGQLNSDEIAGLGTCSFQKKTTFLRSFLFFIKEWNDLCILSRSL